MMRAVDLFKRYREAINPPYSSKDLLPILGTLFILFALPVIVLSLNSQRSLQSSADRKLLPANLQVYHGNANEPAIPGNVTWITGCGFTPGVKIQLVDSVTYKAPYYFQTPPGFSFPSIGQAASKTLYIDPDSNGCVDTGQDPISSYKGWGTGGHYLRAYQLLRGNKPKLMAEQSYSTTPHHPYGMFDKTYSEYRYSYNPNPAPLSADPMAPSVKITWPVLGSIVPVNSTVTITAEASGGVETPTVAFYVNNDLQCNDTAPPYECIFQTASDPRTYTFTVVAYSPSSQIYPSAKWRATTYGINSQ